MALLMGEQGVQLTPLQTPQRGRRDDQPGCRTGQPPGVGPLALQHHQPAARRLLARQQRGPYEEFGPACAPGGAGQHDLAHQHREAPAAARGEQDGGGRRPRACRAQGVGVHDGTRRPAEHLPAHRLPGRRRAERHRQQTAQQDGRHDALPHPEGDDRFTVRPVGPGEQPRGDGGGQGAEQQQGHGDHHGQHPMSARPLTGTVRGVEVTQTTHALPPRSHPQERRTRPRGPLTWRAAW